MSEWIDVGPITNFSLGSQKVVPFEDTAVVVVHTAEGLFAVENRCTHAEVPLAGGTVEGATISCPRHGARFCLKSGAALTPPAYEPVTTFPVRIEGGRVLIRDSRWD